MVCSSPCYTLFHDRDERTAGRLRRVGRHWQACSGHRQAGTARGWPERADERRQAEAARNDQRILESARAVFVADPGAPITAVAKHARQSASQRAVHALRQQGEELLRTLCTDGLQTFCRKPRPPSSASSKRHDHWQVFAAFMQNPADADTSSLTRAFAYKFAPTPEMYALTNRSAELSEEFFGLIRDVLRPDLVLHDVSLSFELVAAIKFADPARTTELRHRYLALILDGMRAVVPRRAARRRRSPGWRSANAGTPG